MRYNIVSKGDHKSNSIKENMEAQMQDTKMIKDTETPEIVISVGGDGTLLEAFHKYSYRLSETAFVGVHTGHLGFYADWLPHESDKLIREINDGDYEVIKYPLIDITVHYNDEKNPSHHIALNEATMKTEDNTTLVADVSLRGKHFERFRGDGLCISTPSGSTAYNKALGGALIHPSLRAIQLTEIASINNRVFRTVGSPLVLPAHHYCLITPVDQKTIMTSIDHVTTKHHNVKSIEYKVSEEEIRFARFRPFPFWKRVHDSFISDGRDE
ncbi:NAD kinase [Staphylococcus condimenti]|uniref:NAD kinase n=1 Tax=Staphylococcus condimenti TaxID=70255 RepID=A0A143PC23_9STAP|nr:MULTISPECIES: NAD kinase [Staphylococcus]AMY05309.1 NAD kinase [Staphylococcus condimenti]APR61516.1 NAD kinase [Staphylococcus condimenti]MDK8645318.1 NAD kinase [Staphylococcus condimenti]OFO98771.1 NAD kinase [Staphylococcus sp. HMSC065E08]PNZ58376.1 NAD kinase [Staphylococcus condimenti]